MFITDDISDRRLLETRTANTISKHFSQSSFITKFQKILAGRTLSKRTRFNYWYVNKDILQL
jgi:hypothetical protein